MYSSRAGFEVEPEVGEAPEGAIVFNPSDREGLERLGEKLREQYGLKNAPVLYYSRKPWWIRWARRSQAS